VDGRQRRLGQQRSFGVTAIRLLVDPPAAGAWNMAVDEALLESAEAGVTTLRFYQWSEPTLSLGYFQAADERQGHAASRGCPLVRRASGGGAIVHDRELTYSFAAPIAGRLAAAAALYDVFHDTLIDVLGRWQVLAARCKPAVHLPAAGGRPPFLCFQRRARGDVLCGDAKIAGSAQRRQRGGLLQHGSVLLARSPSAPELAGIVEAAGVSPDPHELASTWVTRLSEDQGFVFQELPLTPRERQRAADIQASHFLNRDWTFRR
jgi:lipoate-protein ligase A